jgi:hypothetical protein
LGNGYDDVWLHHAISHTGLHSSLLGFAFFGFAIAALRNWSDLKLWAHRLRYRRCRAGLHQLWYP